MADRGIVRWLIGKAMRLPSRQTGRVTVMRDMAVAMRDGVELLADHHFAGDAPTGPVVLMRSPYSRGGLFGMMAALLAERGLQVIIQSVRGTAGSGGVLDPMRQEAADGADTIDWIRAQRWFSGQLYTFGGSYLGNVQWAMASVAGEKMDGLAMSVTLSNFRDELLGGGGLTQAGTLSWTMLMRTMVEFVPGQKMARPDPKALDTAHGHLPVGTMDEVAFGKPIWWWKDWTSHDDPEDPWWQAIDHSGAVAKLAAPTAMVAGWQDIFLPFQIRDFAARQAAGRAAWLTVGPWTHSSPGGMIEGLRQAIAMFPALAAGRTLFADRAPVRIFLQTAKKWREFPSWPPPGGRPLQLHLRSGGRLEASPPATDEGATTYTYDPADPTPAVHGPMVMGASKVRDMIDLEQRDDTILFTGSPLDRDVDVIGPVTVELSVRSDREHTDFYACLCDVDRKGRSVQVCDGYIRLRPARPEADVSGVRRITIDCWPTAWRFRRDHRLRLIVASGAHPRYARNLGTGEPLATATDMVPAHQAILHGIEYGSSISLLSFESG